MEEAIVRMIADQLHVEKQLVTENARLVEDLAADSLDMFQLMVRVEENFDARLSGEVLGRKPQTVKELVTYIMEALA